ncbi:MAG: hypothetical protein HN700_10285 [Verrucomicrobia bacterium]|nr:hypothetical protein [Verrucomicrobiota bacterium]
MQDDTGDRLNGLRHGAGAGVSALARWVDSFFELAGYTEEEADARISLRQSVEASHRDDVKFRTRVSGAVSLPNLSGRIKLVLEEMDELGSGDADVADSIAESAEDFLDASTLGLQYTFLSEIDYDFSIKAGARISDLSLYAGPRVRLQTKPGGLWRTRFTQRIRWYTDIGWRSDTDVDLDRRLGARNLFRQRLSSSWREDRYDTEGFLHTLSSTFTQPFGTRRALSYIWSSVWGARPTDGWRSTRLQLAYRTQLSRDWAVLQVSPYLSWQDEHGWNINPGVVVSLSFVLEDDSLTPTPTIRDR